MSCFYNCSHWAQLVPPIQSWVWGELLQHGWASRSHTLKENWLSFPWKPPAVTKSSVVVRAHVPICPPCWIVNWLDHAQATTAVSAWIQQSDLEGPVSLQSSPLWLLHSRCPLSWEGPWALAVVLSVLYGHPFVAGRLLTLPLHSLIRFEVLLCPLHKETSLVRSKSHTNEVHLMSQNTIPFGEPPGVCVFRHSAVVDGVFHTSGSRLWKLLFGSVMPSLISPYRFSLAAKTMNYW